ncbi:TonB-dependent receptor plug domain-containing protein [Phaeovulum vinaykumarii]|uniref:Vitamin B12 transporter n=1 Tax=Phaeovulum vinaykumarii TaxID=407234 RepID=A0A1N7L8N6_9RHOB|nr:TonB-dependent receptor [Phaeovulum vinaykumarii]SIS70205.1 vitamin B12 transporter [Phaeovulum vinaykumarii]SOB99051.1 vitamin B12 transporter [Phaeovulum vinaykumarii]
MGSNRVFRHGLLASAAVLTLPVAAGAQDTGFDLGEIVVSAGLEATEADRTGSTVDVIDAEALSGAAVRVSDILTAVPGVTVRGNGPMGTTTAVVLRGAPAAYVPVLIDGIEVGDPTAISGDFDFGGMIGADLSRIEVLKGSQSAIYGANAVGGVIDITSFRPTEMGTSQQIRLEFGSNETALASYSLGHKTERAELAFTLSRVTSDGFSALDENDGNFEADGYRATRASLHARYTLDNGTLIGLNAFREVSRGEFDDWVGDVLGTPGDDYTDRKATGVRAFTEFSTGRIDHTLSLTHYRSDRQSTSNGAVSDFDGQRSKAAYKGAMDLGARTRLVFGADSMRESAAGFRSTTISGVFADLAFAATPDLDLDLTYRHDDHSRFGGFDTARLTAVYRPREDLLFRAAIGNGFRAPSIYQLFSIYGDAGLQPEESLTAELGVEKRWGTRASLKATAFYLEADNLIGFDPLAVACGQPWGCYAQVPGVSRRSGVEIEGRLALREGLDLSLAYTYTDSARSGPDWAQVALHDLRVTAEAQLTPLLSGSLAVQHVAGRPTGLEDYTVVDAGMAYDLGTGRSAYLRVENVFDTEYQTVRTYGTADRTVHVGLSATF